MKGPRVFSSVAEPPDAASRREAKPVVCYEVDLLPSFDVEFYERARQEPTKIAEVLVPPRDGKTFEVCVFCA